MTIEQYWTTLIKRWKLVVICFLLVGVGAFIGTRLMTRVYQSKALVEVFIPLGNTPSDYYNGLLASDQLVQTEAILATSDPVLRQVATHYPGLAVAQISSEVTATPKLNTQLFEISVQDPSPTRAAALANEIAQALIQSQAQMIQQTTAQGGSFLLLVQSAQPDFTPVRPNTLLNTGGGLVVGLLLGMLLALLYERLDRHVRTPEELTRLLDWPVLATVWRADSSDAADMINPTGSNVNVESYRILRTNIGFSSLDKPLRSLIVSSALPHDGKSVIAANLAIFMAKAGKNTLLVDADLRSPTQHILFNLSPNNLGLSNAVLAFSMPNVPRTPSYNQFAANASTGGPTMSNLSLEPFVHSVGIPNLWVMQSGPLPPNPSEFLESKVMQRFLEVIANCGIEVVIFDTPPLLGLSDASILAAKVDGALVVIDTTCATREKLKQMKAVLSQTGVHVLGCVANKVQHKRSDSAYSYYTYTDDQNSGEKSTKNGHMPSIPVTPLLAESSFEQRNRSN